MRSLKFSYVETLTKEWLDRSFVGRLRSTMDLQRVQKEAREVGMTITLRIILHYFLFRCEV